MSWSVGTDVEVPAAGETANLPDLKSQVSPAYDTLPTESQKQVDSAVEAVTVYLNGGGLCAGTAGLTLSGHSDEEAQAGIKDNVGLAIQLK